MNRKLVLGMIVIAGIFAAFTTFAQRRPYDQFMKDVDATTASLKKHLDETGAQGVDEVILNERGGLIRNRQERVGKPPSPDAVQASADAALQDAAKLQALFKEVEQFWSSVNASDAVDLSKDAEVAATNVIDKVRGKDYDAAQVAFGRMRESCRDCHFSHRETTGKGFVIKP